MISFDGLVVIVVVVMDFVLLFNVSSELSSSLYIFWIDLSFVLWNMDYYDDSINDNVDMVDEINNEENEIILTDCLMRGRGVTSSLWNYFDRLPNDRALCRGYKKDLAGYLVKKFHGRSTSDWFCS